MVDSQCDPMNDPSSAFESVTEPTDIPGVLRGPISHDQPPDKAVERDFIRLHMKLLALAQHVDHANTALSSRVEKLESHTTPVAPDSPPALEPLPNNPRGFTVPPVRPMMTDCVALEPLPPRPLGILDHAWEDIWADGEPVRLYALALERRDAYHVAECERLRTRLDRHLRGIECGGCNYLKAECARLREALEKVNADRLLGWRKYDDMKEARDTAQSERDALKAQLAEAQETGRAQAAEHEKALAELREDAIEAGEAAVRAAVRAVENGSNAGATIAYARNECIEQLDAVLKKGKSDG